jgi:hypothetical protein
MKSVYDSIDFKKHQFKEASGIMKLQICKDTHKIATTFCPETYEEIFNARYQLKEKCTKHTGREIKGTTRRRRF